MSAGYDEVRASCKHEVRKIIGRSILNTKWRHCYKEVTVEHDVHSLLYSYNYSNSVVVDGVLTSPTSIID